MTLKKWLLYPILTLLSLALIGVAIIVIAGIVVYPRLPSVTGLQDYRPVIPLRIYTQDGQQIGEFGQERRHFIKIQDTPQKMLQAIMAAEDERFYTHSGVDYISVARAMLSNLSSGHTVSGASTITQQVAKNFFLSPERTFTRKFKEALLAYKIEKNLSKDQIFELYVNQINLGQRAFGFAAAARTYFGKDIRTLNIAEFAMLAGLPKAPSANNPISNPERAKIRQLYVLGRMLKLGFITEAEYTAAKGFELHIEHTAEAFPVNGEYVAEMVRQFMYDQFKDAAYTQGYKVYTTLNAEQQENAYYALRYGLMDYDKRHGYRGAEGFVDLSVSAADEFLDEQLAEIKDSGDIYPAVVLSANGKVVTVYRKGGGRLDITGSGLTFARAMLSNKANEAVRIRPGAVVRVMQNKDGDWQITQLPQIEGAFVAANPKNGAIQALVGGFDFSRNNFNHVTQAWRQPGSSFKPFIYSAALDRGVTAATIVNDAPLVIDQGGQHWEPKNSDGQFSGPISVRRALTKSKNLVSIRLLQSITPEFAQTYVQKFGFAAARHPAYLTMALGAGEVTPFQMAGAYSIFANGGYKVQAYFIDRIEDQQGHVVFKSKPYVAGLNASKAIDPRNAYIMTSIMGDVVRYGTAARAMALGRKDLAGKTGTTNDVQDAWFAGYSQQNLVGITWVGFDTPKPLGGQETGGHAALPIWMNFMSKALKGVPERPLPMPDGMVTVGGEYFYSEYTETNPDLNIDNHSTAPDDADPGTSVDTIKDMLF